MKTEEQLIAEAIPIILNLMAANELDARDKQLLHAMIQAFQAGIGFMGDEVDKLLK